MREENSKLPRHWGFAVGQSVHALRNLTLCLDFEGEVGHLPYIGVTPAFLIEVIEGFLGESDHVILPGHRTELIALRDVLTKQVIPAFEQGKAAGQKFWQQTGLVCGALSVADRHKAALNAAPSDINTRGWFAEGFSFAFAEAETRSLAK